MHDLKATVTKEDTNPYLSFLSSIFAGLGEMGMLDQDSVNTASQEVAEQLYSYLEANGHIPNLTAYPDKTDFEALNHVVNHINKFICLSGEYKLQLATENKIILLINNGLCTICPKSAAKTKVEDSLCHIPSIIEKLVNLIIKPGHLKLTTKGFEKEGSTCCVEFKLTE
jgi:hypothetical protein